MKVLVQTAQTLKRMNPTRTKTVQKTMLLLFCLVVMEQANVFVAQHTRSSVEAADLYQIGHLMLVTETGKVILASIMEL